jgi:hypothetical protein
VTCFPEDGGNRFLQNVGSYLPNYTTSHPRRQYFSGIHKFTLQIFDVLSAFNVASESLEAGVIRQIMNPYANSLHQLSRALHSLALLQKVAQSSRYPCNRKQDPEVHIVAPFSLQTATDY